MVNIVYLTRINFFSSKANVHTIAKTCEALSQVEGVSLSLVSVDDSLFCDEKKNEFLAEHDILHAFSIISLASVSNIFKNSSNFFIYNFSTFFANISLLKYVWRYRKNIDVIYFRDHLILFVVLFAKYVCGKKVVYESHYILTKPFGQWLTEGCVSVSDGVVTIAIVLKDFYQKFNKNIVVSFCASSEKEKFKTNFPTSFFREKTGLSNNLFYMIYTGNIDVTGNGDSYGVEDVVRALPYLTQDVCFVAVGKKTDGKHSLEQLAESLGVVDRFICINWVSRDAVVDYVLSSDVLIIPKSGAKLGNSPTKIFEYLASGRPIVSADTVPMQEVLHNAINASLVDYNDPQAWARAINHIRSDVEYKNNIVAGAMRDADLYTWDSRAKIISSMIKKIHA